jgi:hypothetical protein
MEPKVRLLPPTAAALALLLAAPGLARPDEPGEDAHGAVRAALLDAATVPSPPGHDAEPDERRLLEGAQRARHEAEREAHERAAERGRRHGGEAGAEHGPRGSGSPHGAPGAGGTMDGGLDCHDPARNGRTRDMHDGEREPGGPHHR